MQMDIRQSIESLKKADPNFKENDLYNLKQLELQDALKSCKWVDIQRIENELEELKNQGFDKSNSREVIMTDSQKMRYDAFLKNASPELVKDTMQMIDLLECIIDLYSKLPDDSEDFELIKKTVLYQAFSEGCSMDELKSLQTYINAIYRVEMRKRRRSKNIN